jgi:hypothetical protein
VSGIVAEVALSRKEQEQERHAKRKTSSDASHFSLCYLSYVPESLDLT